MSDQIPDFSPLSSEQLAALNDTQKEIFLSLDAQDRQFFAKNFSAAGLGQALERKWETVQSRLRTSAFDQRIKENLQAQGGASAQSSSLSVGEVAAGAAGIAGAVGIGVLAKKIAVDGKAAWRGVSPRDLVDALVSTFARQEKTDIRFDPPSDEGNLHATVLLRSPSGMLPALNIDLTHLADATQVYISKVSSQSLMETIKDQGQKILDLVQDGLSLGRKGGAENLLDLAGQVMDQGFDVVQAVKDLDLEDRAWAAIQRVADPLQMQYDERMADEKERQLRLEMAWDDYNTCPKCRVPFGGEDSECRVCGTARPAKPEQPDPRSAPTG
ncbi:MAG: hypothetical protein JXB15_08510 [Anaerolineales bacterium]|nr:hypothetical protein [Anaerolineales bacterium]